jgi:cytochrome P450
VIANAVIDGQPISDVDAMGYYITVAFAGHDTTASSLAGVLRQMLPRIRALELNGTPTRTVTNFVGGPKSVPIRFSV